ncbi:flagellar biosynthetic protein FliR [Marivivens aquimaris]|uniref:flagellar biosynthetic protein FliR n=1 Tax=Marivivens aquimaris TaxID=2774876 RepID=UPI00187FEB7F|nr:flagellar biosynthetic protein FliR [Marivivens aquimaris]
MTLADIGAEAVWAAMILLARIGACIALAPAFGEMTLPVRIRLGIALAYTVMLWPIVPIPAEQTLNQEIIAIIVEALNGLFWGILLRLVVIALETAGTIIGQSMSLSQLFGNTAGAEPLPVAGQILRVAGLALACALGLHVKLAAYLIATYQIAPVGDLISAANMMQAGLETISSTFALAFSLAAPFVIGALLYNLTIGFMNRAMPQFILTIVGAPVSMLGGIFLLIVMAPLILGLWIEALDRMLAP